MIRFAFDGDPAEFTAHNRGADWNGWMRPIVDRETLSAVVARMNQLDDERRTELEWTDGGVAVIREADRGGGTELNRFTLTPDKAGHYLLDMGLTIAEIC